MLSLIGNSHTSAYNSLREFVDSPSSSCSKSECDVKAINQIIERFLVEEDLNSLASKELIRDIKWKVLSRMAPLDRPGAIPDCKATFELLAVAEFMQKNHIPGSCVLMQSSPCNVEAMRYMVNIACLSINLCGHEDGLVINESIVILQDKTPLLVPSRICFGMIPKLTGNVVLDNDWWFYLSIHKNMILFLPKHEESTALCALQKFGYDSSQLISLNWEQLQSSIERFDEMSEELYVEQLCSTIPQLFIGDSDIRKRFNIIGHGGVLSRTENTQDRECFTLGMTLAQTGRLLTELAQRGMDYCNLRTCYGGKHLVLLLGNQQRSYTVSVCSIGDFPLIGAVLVPDLPHVQIRLTDTARFWNRLNDALSDSTVPNSVQAEQCTQALEYMYGQTMSGIPMISFKGDPRFIPLNVHQRIAVLSSRQLGNNLTRCANDCSFRESSDRIDSKSAMESSSHRVDEAVRQSSDVISTSPERNIIRTSHLGQHNQSSVLKAECLLIIPPIVEDPIYLQKDSFSSKFPRILSRIPGDNHLFIASLHAEGGLPKRVLEESFLFHNLDEESSFFSQDGSSTTRVVVIRELFGRQIEEFSSRREENGTYVNVVCVVPSSREKRFVLFQKKECLDRWYCYWNYVWKEEEVSVQEVHFTLYHLMRSVITPPEASSCLDDGGAEVLPRNEMVVKLYETWFDRFDFHGALTKCYEAIESDDMAALESAVEGLDAFSCKALMLHAVRKNHLKAVWTLGSKASDLDIPFSGEERILTTAARMASPEIVQALLQMGCRPTVDKEIASPLNAVMDRKGDQEVIVEILCKNGANLKGIPERCIACNLQSCLDIVLRYWPKSEDLSEALKMAVQCRQSTTAVRLINEKKDSLMVYGHLKDVLTLALEFDQREVAILLIKEMELSVLDMHRGGAEICTKKTQFFLELVQCEMLEITEHCSSEEKALCIQAERMAYSTTIYDCQEIPEEIQQYVSVFIEKLISTYDRYVQEGSNPKIVSRLKKTFKAFKLRLSRIERKPTTLPLLIQLKQDLKNRL